MPDKGDSTNEVTAVPSGRRRLLAGAALAGDVVGLLALLSIRLLARKPPP